LNVVRRWWRLSSVRRVPEGDRFHVETAEHDVEVLSAERHRQ
jgi:hypothetical protein